jgi:hypothetical protein
VVKDSKTKLIPSRGFQSSMDYVMTFGIGDKKIDSLQVIWAANSN